MLEESRVEIQQLHVEVAEHKSAEERFRTIAESVPIGVYVTNAQDEGVFVNAAWLGLIGTTSGEALHRGWAAVIHPLDRKRATEGWERSKSVEGWFAGEFRYLQPGGRIGWLSLRADAMKVEGRVIGYARTLIDVTDEHVEREALLAASQISPTLVLVLKVVNGEGDVELRIEYANEGAARQLGLGPEEISTANILESLKTDSEQGLRSLLLEGLVYGNAFEREIDSSLIDTNGRKSYVRATPLPGCLVVAVQITNGVGS